MPKSCISLYEYMYLHVLNTYCLIVQFLSRNCREKSLDRKKVVPLGRLERPTRGLGNRCSIHLSYRGNQCLVKAFLFMCLQKRNNTAI